MATIVTRAGKGAPLTHDEVDDNFSNLNTDKVETSAIGTAAAADTGDFATAAQGTTADSAVQPNDSPTFGTVTATSFSDGSVSVPTNTVVNGSAKAYGKIDQTSSGHPLYSPSLNISSTSDDGTGQTGLSFTSSMSGAGYSIAGGTDFGADAYSSFQSQYAGAGSVTVYNSPDYNASTGDGVVSFSVLGDLA